MNTAFKVHVHRAHLHDLTKTKKWYAHISTWGDQPRAFEFININVPTTCVVDMTNSCWVDASGKGCAQAWIAGEVPEDEVTWTEDLRTLHIGTPKSDPEEA